MVNWKQWWIVKTTIPVYGMLVPLLLFAEVEVLHDTPDIGDADYFPGPNLRKV